MRIKFFVCVSFCFLSLNASASLWDRGHGLIYDDVLNVTWMQDANFARTSGWSEENYIDPDDPENAPYFGDEPLLDGSMGFYFAKPYIDQLVFRGYDDWRLPSIRQPIQACGDAIDCNGFVDSGELGFMFYHNLGNAGGVVDPSCSSGIGCQGHNTGFLDKATNTMKYFSNVMASYFYGEWDWQNVLFRMSSGRQDEVVAHHQPTAWVWAVRDGDVIGVPEVNITGAPIALATLIGLVLIAGERRRASCSRKVFGQI